MMGDFPESNIFHYNQYFDEDLAEIPLLRRDTSRLRLIHNTPFDPLYSGGNGGAGTGIGAGGAAIGGGAGEDGGFVRRVKWWRKFLAWCKKLRNKHRRRSRR